ncbi:MAG: D-alanyl-D-alanine carboxypeptidase [Clostridia bacterium]|nr:D-alanyl-D-alanine carboxypeptidase [Clostridia bacterium]
MWLKRGLCLLLLLSTLCVYAMAEEPEISSLSAVVYLPETGQVLYEKDGDTRRPMASTTKLMTALVAAETLDLSAELTVSAEAVRVEGSSLGLHGGDRITGQDLLIGMLLESGNDAANAVALTVEDSLEAFARRMNQKAAELGMTNSGFVTPSGLDAEGHGASARDMALLGAAVLENPALAAICATKSTQIIFGNPPVSHTVSNHNRLLSKMEGCVGLKTGYTTKAGRCLVSAAVRDDITLVVATLNGHDYWNDHQSLYDYGFSKVRRLTLPETVLPMLAVSGGVKKQVALCYETPIAPIVGTEVTDPLTVRLELPSFVTAPVSAGEVVGYIRYENSSGVLCSAPLTAAGDVEAQPVASPWVWWWRWFCTLLAALG